MCLCNFLARPDIDQGALCTMDVPWVYNGGRCFPPRVRATLAPSAFGDFPSLALVYIFLPPRLLFLSSSLLHPLYSSLLSTLPSTYPSFSAELPSTLLIYIDRDPLSVPLHPSQ